MHKMDEVIIANTRLTQRADNPPDIVSITNHGPEKRSSGIRKPSLVLYNIHCIWSVEEQIASVEEQIARFTWHFNTSELHSFEKMDSYLVSRVVIYSTNVAE